MKLNVIYIILLCIITVSREISGSMRSSYGESCNQTQKCNSRGWLGCFDGICDCLKQEEMEFHPEKKKCVSKSGERCKFGLEEAINNHLFELTDCVDYAECTSEGYCVCGSKYHEMFNGSCALSNTIGGNCSAVDQCSKYEKLKCVEGICECDKEVSVKNLEGNSCVGISNKPCLNGKCISGATCSSDKCTCLPHHYHNSTDNLCYQTKGVFERCSDGSECMQKPGLMLRCVEGICNCQSNLKYDTVQKYEYKCSQYEWYYCSPGAYNYELYLTKGFNGEEVSRCVPLIGERCPDGYCVSNAKCVAQPSQNNLYANGVCQCLNTNYIANKNKTKCLARYDLQCQYSDECNEDQKCVNKKCSCPMAKRQKYSDYLKECITSVGGHCTGGSTCVSNGFCNTTVGQCKCKEGFVVSKNGDCEVEFGNDCSGSSAVCDTIAALGCVDNKCSCPDQMYIYSPNLRKCVGLAGALCNESSDQRECTLNAQCSMDKYSLVAECQCTDGYIQDKNYLCQKEDDTTTTVPSILIADQEEYFE